MWTPRSVLATLTVFATTAPGIVAQTTGSSLDFTFALTGDAIITRAYPSMRSLNSLR